MTTPEISATAAQSHDIRSTFERYAFLVYLVVISAICVIAVIGVLWPPSLPGAVDWGKSITERIKDIKDSVLDMLIALLGPLGISITRGHLDEGLKAKALAQFVNGDQK